MRNNVEEAGGEYRGFAAIDVQVFDVAEFGTNYLAEALSGGCLIRGEDFYTVI